METEKLADTFMVVMSQFLFLKASWIKRVYHLNGAGVIHKNQREKMWSTKNSRQIGCMTISIYQYYQVLVNISRTPSSPCVVRCFETPRVGLGTCGPLRNILRRRCELLFGSRNFHLVDPTKYIHVYTSISKVGSTLAYLFFWSKVYVGIAKLGWPRPQKNSTCQWKVPLWHLAVTESHLLSNHLPFQRSPGDFWTSPQREFSARNWWNWWISFVYEFGKMKIKWVRKKLKWIQLTVVHMENMKLALALSYIHIYCCQRLL